MSSLGSREEPQLNIPDVILEEDLEAGDDGGSRSEVRSAGDGASTVDLVGSYQSGFSSIGDSYDAGTDDHGDLSESSPLLLTGSKASINNIPPPGYKKRDRKTSFMSGRSVAIRRLVTSVSQSVNTISQSYGHMGFSGDAYAAAAARAQNNLGSKTFSLQDVPSDDRYTPSFVMFLTMLGMLLGLSFFAMPYLVGHGGPTMIASIVAGGVLSGYTSLLLTRCQYQVSKTKSGMRKRVYSTYIELGKAAFKNHGELMMQLTVASNLMSDMYCLILCGQVTVDLFKKLVEFDARVWMCIWVALVLPLFFIKRMSILAWFGMVALLTYVGVLVLSYAILIANFDKWELSNINHSFSPEYFFLGYGLILNSHNVHLAIPAMEASTKHPESFPTIQKVSWGVNIILKVSAAVMTAAAFGTATQGSFLVNLSHFGVMSIVINGIMAAYLYCQFPTSMFVVLEMLDNYVQPHFYLLRKETKGHYIWMILSRLFVSILILFIAVCIPNFELVASFVGNLRGTITVLVFPVLFYLRIKKRHISLPSRIFHIALLVVGILCGLAGMGYSVKGMIMGQSVVAG